MTERRLIIPHHLAFFVVLIAILVCAKYASAHTPMRLDYYLDVSPNLLRVSGRVCGEHLTRSSFNLQGAMQWAHPEKPLPGKDGQCLSYNAHLNARKESTTFNHQIDTGVISTSLNDLLPCPVLSSRTQIDISKTVSLKLPTGKNASFPGEILGENQYLLQPRPCGWSSGVLIGDIEKSTIEMSNSAIEVAMPARLHIDKKNKLRLWLKRGISALRTTYGQLPVRNVQVLIFPTGPNTETVPWGQVMRGGGDAVHLYVDETKSLSALNDDWVLVHELSHLLHPYLQASDGWFAEGLASYYQNVLRARAGLLSGEQAWQKLHAGFQRGLNQFEPHMTLEKDTRQMMRERKYMRVYWSGAAIALLADVQLREESDGKMSLDEVLKNLSECCLPTKGRRWRASDLLQQLDETNQTVIFSSLYKNYVMGAKFPALKTAYETLGIQSSDQGLRFDTSPRALHKLIMTSPQ